MEKKYVNTEELSELLNIAVQMSTKDSRNTNNDNIITKSLDETEKDTQEEMVNKSHHTQRLVSESPRPCAIDDTSPLTYKNMWFNTGQNEFPLMRQDKLSSLIIKLALVEITDNTSSNKVFVFSNQPIDDAVRINFDHRERKAHKFEIQFTTQDHPLHSSIDSGLNTAFEREAHYVFSQQIDNAVLANQSIHNSIDSIGALESNFNFSKEGNILDLLLAMQSKINPHYLDECVWLTSPRILSLMKTIKDKNGRYVLDGDTIFGKKVYVHQNFDTLTNQILFTNLKEAMTAIIGKRWAIYHDQISHRGKTLHYINNYFSSMITRPESIISLSIKDYNTTNFTF